MMKRLKAQIEEAKLPEQSFESTYITKRLRDEISTPLFF